MFAAVIAEWPGPRAEPGGRHKTECQPLPRLALYTFIFAEFFPVDRNEKQSLLLIFDVE